MTEPAKWQWERLLELAGEALRLHSAKGELLPADEYAVRTTRDWLEEEGMLPGGSG